MVYWKGSCPLLVGGLLLLKEVLLLQRQEEGSQKEGAPMSLNRDLNRNLNRARGALWCVSQREQPTAARDAEWEGGGGVGGCAVLQTTVLRLQRRVSRGCKGSKRGMGQKQGIEVLCRARQTLRWLLSGALILLKGSTAPA